MTSSLVAFDSAPVRQEMIGNDGLPSGTNRWEHGSTFSEKIVRKTYWRSHASSIA
jgi:hypothetical protein